MAAGPDVVFQGALLSGAWGGYSDFLERVARPSALGGWCYEVTDSKLKRKPDRRGDGARQPALHLALKWG